MGQTQTAGTFAQRLADRAAGLARKADSALDAALSWRAQADEAAAARVPDAIAAAERALDEARAVLRELDSIRLGAEGRVAAGEKSVARGEVEAAEIPALVAGLMEVQATVAACYRLANAAQGNERRAQEKLAVARRAS